MTSRETLQTWIIWNQFFDNVQLMTIIKYMIFFSLSLTIWFLGNTWQFDTVEKKGILPLRCFAFEERKSQMWRWIMRGTKLFAHRSCAIYHVMILSCYFPRFVSPSVKELIRINRCSLYALSSLSCCQKRSFSWLIMIRWATSHRLHANFVIRHVYNQLIINHKWSFILSDAPRPTRSSKNPLLISALLIKMTSHPRHKYLN